MATSQTNFLLIRLAETTQAAVDVVSGARQEASLSERGRLQAEALARRLGRYPLHALYSSPSPGAVETAELIAAEAQLQVEQDAAFREIELGVLESMPREEFRRQYPLEYSLFFETPTADSGDEPIIPKAEPRNAVLQRATNRLLDLARGHSEGGNIAIITHGHLIKVVLCGLLGIGFEKIWSLNQPNAALNLLSHVDGSFTAHTIGDLAHLESEGIESTNVKMSAGGLAILNMFPRT